jgi:hypothetical protein
MSTELKNNSTKTYHQKYDEGYVYACASRILWVTLLLI